MAPASIANRENETHVVLSRLRENRPELFERAEVVGAWVWLSFDTKPDSETREYLKAEGFRWNRRRAVWQHCCGIWRPRASHDPRFAFGVIPASMYQQAEESGAA